MGLHTAALHSIRSCVHAGMDVDESSHGVERVGEAKHAVAESCLVGWP